MNQLTQWRHFEPVQLATSQGHITRDSRTWYRETWKTLAAAGRCGFLMSDLWLESAWLSLLLFSLVLAREARVLPTGCFWALPSSQDWGAGFLSVSWRPGSLGIALDYLFSDNLKESWWRLQHSNSLLSLAEHCLFSDFSCFLYEMLPQ